MKSYQWQIGGFTGSVKANDLKTATMMAISAYFDTVPYPPETSTRIDIYIKQI